MNTPARRDGTPDRKRNTPRSAKPQSAGRSNPERRADPRRSEAPAAEPTKKPHRKGGTPLNKRGRPAAAKPKAKRPAPVPKISNAKPARHQHSDAGPTQLPAGEGVRLQKVLAQAGVASRRAAEELIAAGRVEVDGSIVT
ncbi:S4 domain-containing protein, partial [Rhodococcus chondri]